MKSPKVVVLDDYELLSRAGADIVTDLVSGKPDSSVVVATGETPMGLYRQLADKREMGTFDASGLTVLQLDEYRGIDPRDPRTLFGWMMRSFVEPLGISPERVVRFPTDGDAIEACAAYERALEEAGGYDLAILGIGENGHIGFNEPPSDASAPTREIELSQESVESNARYWGGLEHAPRRGITAGMSELLQARKILLVASGRHKLRIVHRALQGPVAPEVPASYLQEAEDVTVLVDREAWEGWD
jgi:glucosamine-6-phosphate deaminase